MDYTTLTNAELIETARVTLRNASYQTGRWDAAVILPSKVSRRRKRAIMNAAVAARKTIEREYDDVCDELQARGIAEQFSDYSAVADAGRDAGRASVAREVAR